MKINVIYNWLLVIGRGIGQVMFQNNALSGLLMLLGIFLNSWQLGVGAIAGNVISTVTAYVAGYSRDDIKNGLYGFNGTLVGIAVGVFMQLSLISILLMAIASSFSSWIVQLFHRQHLFSGFTAPFILAVWLLLGLCTCVLPDCLLPAESVAHITIGIDYFQSMAMAIGQVMFQGNIWSGLFFLAAILINSRMASFYTLVGALLPIPFAILLGVDTVQVNMGLMGYNGVLCAIAIGEKSWISLVWAICSVLLSVVLQILGTTWGITTLTAPFVLSVWIVVLLRNRMNYR